MPRITSGFGWFRNRDAVIRESDNANRAAFKGNVVDVETTVGLTDEEAS